MENWVVLNSPYLICLFAVALILNVYSLVKKLNGYVLKIVSVALFLFGAVQAFLWGAKLQEMLVVTLVFLCVNLLSFGKYDEGNK